jgi:hypothetical protein
MNYQIYFYQLWVEVLIANIEFATKIVVPVLTRLA